MGFFKDFVENIGGITKDSVFSGISSGLHNIQMKSGLPGRSTSQEDDNNILGYRDNYNFDVTLYDNPEYNENEFITYDDLDKSNDNKFDYTERIDKISEDGFSNLERSDYHKKYSNKNSDEYSLNIPDWGYNDFINERNIFIKHLSNGFDEPGWFYFKIFFDFSSDHGLFGGIMKSKDLSDDFISTNSAVDYLNQCKEIFKYEKLEYRIKYLERFTKLLSFVNIHAPWVFKSIKNISQLSIPKINNTNNDEQYIEIGLDQDAIDMRISTLLSLYKNACYDDINNKEIIPENLRKFDMCILIFSAPIKFVHDVYNNGKYKELYLNNNQNKTKNIMSFKLFKLMNCEIDPLTLGSYIPDDVNNEKPFGLGNNTIKIKYERSYEYNMNEYIGFMFGSDGIYIDEKNVDKNINVKNLTTFSEEKIHNNINKIFENDPNFILGNIFGQQKQIYERNTKKTSSRTYTEYAKTKFGIMNNNRKFILDLGYNVLYKLLGTGYNANAEVLKVGKQVIGDGTVLNGHGDYKVGSAIWRAKMKRLLYGNTKLSDRELRLKAIGKAFHTDWKQNLQNKVLNSISPVI